MDRRELLKLIALLTGGVVIGGEVFLSGCTTADKPVELLLTEQDIPFLDEVAETILPATKTPGAKAAQVGQFMKTYVNDCYDEKQQKTFREGMNKIDEASRDKYSKSFVEATPQQRHELLLELDKQTKDLQAKYKREQDDLEKQARDRGDKTFIRGETPPNQYYTLIKQLALFGYFTSQEAITKAFRFTPVPGEWKACIDYKKGEPAFVGLEG